MNIPIFRLRRASAQSGAVAVEFAFVFPLLFMLLYGTIVYSYVFVVQSSLNFATEQAAQSAVAVSPSAANYDDAVVTQVTATANNLLSWLPAAPRTMSINSRGTEKGAAGCTVSGSTSTPGSGVVIVTICFDVRQIFSQITIPGLGAAPPLPSNLGAQATVRI